MQWKEKSYLCLHVTCRERGGGGGGGERGRERERERGGGGGREGREMERKGVDCRLIYGFIHAYERDCHKERLALMKTNIPRCLCTSKGEWVYVKLP